MPPVACATVVRMLPSTELPIPKVSIRMPLGWNWSSGPPCPGPVYVPDDGLPSEKNRTSSAMLSVALDGDRTSSAFWKALS